MSLSDKLKAEAAVIKAAHAVVNAGVAAHADRIAVDVEAHALNYLRQQLALGCDEGLAIASAEAEALRFHQHLVTSVRDVADPAVRNIDLHCSQCGEVKAHGVRVDTNAETVCTCVCGRFRKFAPGVTPSDAAE